MATANNTRSISSYSKNKFKISYFYIYIFYENCLYITSYKRVVWRRLKYLNYR